jgi:hypothetical protein
MDYNDMMLSIRLGLTQHEFVERCIDPFYLYTEEQLEDLWETYDDQVALYEQRLY